MLHISAEELVSAGLTNREAVVASAIPAIHDLSERLENLPLADPDRDAIVEQIQSICEATFKLIFGRQIPSGHAKMLADLAKEPEPAIAMYPTHEELSAVEDYCARLDEIVNDHIADVKKHLPVSGNFHASHRLIDDWEDSRADTRAETRREFLRAAE